MAGDELSEISQWSEGHSLATHAQTHGGQLPKKDMRMTTHGSLVVRVHASSG